MVYLQKNKDALYLTAARTEENMKICFAFGRVVKAVVMEFKEKEIVEMINFMKTFDLDLEDLTIRHLPTTQEDGTQQDGTKKIKLFVQGLPHRHQNLRRLTIDYKVGEPWCEYVDAFPILPRIEEIQILGMVRNGDVMKIFHRQNCFDKEMWTIKCLAADGFFLKKKCK